MSTKAQRLLSEATTTAWRLEVHDWEDGTTYSVMPAAPVLGSQADAELIVHAVNTLPLYEELREAAGRYLDCAHDATDEADIALSWPGQPCLNCANALRAILHRLEGEER